MPESLLLIAMFEQVLPRRIPRTWTGRDGRQIRIGYGEALLAVAKHLAVPAELVESICEARAHGEFVEALAR